MHDYVCEYHPVLAQESNAGARARETSPWAVGWWEIGGLGGCV